MGLPVIDRDQTLTAAGRATKDFTRLVRNAKHPGASAIGHWSIGELACHVSHVYAAVPRMLCGEASPAKDHRQMGQTWDELLAADPERDLDLLADRIESGWEECKETFATKGWTDEVGWHGDLKVPTYSMAAVVLNEACVHGLDIARADDVAFELGPEDARTITFGLLPTLPDFANQEVVKALEATYEVRVRGGWWVYVTVAGGKVVISEVTDRPIDCRLSVDPVAYLLVGFNRENLWRALAKGQIVAWGRKPWLGFTFAKLFDSP